MSTKHSADEIAKIEALYTAATGSWTTADWQHLYHLPCNGIDHKRLVPCPDCETTDEFCNGTMAGCQHCADVQKAAREAEKVAARAMRLFREGNYDDAAEAALEVCEIESQAIEADYLTCPTWGDWVVWMESLVKQGNDE